MQPRSGCQWRVKAHSDAASVKRRIDTRCTNDFESVDLEPRTSVSNREHDVMECRAVGCHIDVRFDQCRRSITHDLLD
jgi:hypothetical protein